jgi:hypothetical protein
MRTTIAVLLLAGGLVATPAHAGPLPGVDPIVCSALITAAPTVDSLPTSGVLLTDPATGDTSVGGNQAYDCPPYGYGSGVVAVPGMLTIAGGVDGIAPQFVPPAGFLCSGGGDASEFTVNCTPVNAAQTRAAGDGSVECIEVDVAVTSQSSSDGSITGSTHCGNATATATVNTPPPGSASAATGTDQYVNSWACVTVESGNPRPWRVTCRMYYYA